MFDWKLYIPFDCMNCTTNCVSEILTGQCSLCFRASYVANVSSHVFCELLLLLLAMVSLPKFSISFCILSSVVLFEAMICSLAHYVVMQ